MLPRENMTIELREATPAEILADPSIERALRYRRKVRYRHFVRECLLRTARNGVQHRQHSNALIRVIDGKPHVRYLGELHEVTATFYTMRDGRHFISDLRIKSPYLK